MKLKDLTVELSGNDNARTRSLNIGPFCDGLNFIYGERGAGKSTLRNQVGELLLDSVYPSSVERTSIGCNSIAMVLEHNEHRYRIARDEKGSCTSTKMNSVGAALHPDESRLQLPALDRELIDNLSFVAFRDSKSKLARLHQILQNRYQVPLGPDAAGEASDALRSQQQRFDLQNRIEELQKELTLLYSQRASVEAEIESSRSLGLARSSEVDLRIRDLTTRLTELAPARIRLEIDSLQREASRLRLEIQNATTVIQQPTSTPYLPTLYRLLDEIDQQIREVRAVQSNVQRHRVKLKEEMEFRNGLTVDQENHPYHRAREILRQIEGRIDHADSKGDQWVEDHSTPDTQQVSRFLDETCRAVRDDLHQLCDELSTQYSELRNRSATHELKELRHNYSHLSDLIQQILARREQVLGEIQTADAPGAEAIHRAAPEFCLLAASEGHLAARQRFVGPIASVQQSSWTTKSSDTSLQQQQLEAVENRIASLQATLSMAQSESESLTLQLGELNLQKSSCTSQTATQCHSKLVQFDSRIGVIESEISAHNLQFAQLASRVTTPNSLLVTAGNILQHLTRGDFTHIWLSPTDGIVEVRDRLSRTFAVNNIEERGLSQLVQLALVLAANENGIGLSVPLIFDDLFADLGKNRIDETLETITRWCQQTFHQVIVLTQHRFLADRVPEASVWEIEPESISEIWRPATRETLAAVESNESKPVVQSWETQVQDPYSAPPVAEYPLSPLPRPYPLSKYPRTSDRARSNEHSEFANFDSPLEPEVPSQSVAMDQQASVQRATVVSPSVIGDRYDFATVNESTRVDSLGLLDSAQLRCLADNDIVNVSEFLMLELEQDSSDFSACYLIGESLEHLHASAWLMMWVPGLAANDAQALVACGISDPEHLLTSNIESLFERVARFLRSPDGRRFGTSGRTLTRDTVDSWQQRLRQNRNYRQQSRPRYRSDNRAPSRRHALRAWSPQDRSNSREYETTERSDEPSVRDSHDRERSSDRARSADRERASNREREPRQTSDRDSRPTRSPRMRTHENREPRRSAPPIPPRSPRSEAPRKPVAVRQAGGRQSLRNMNEASSESTSSRSTSKSKTTAESPATSKLRFYLELTDHIEAAPSIGPKTGARFEAIGVITIADFLKMTAESLAEKLDYKRLNSKLLRQWQHQARLVCRIPNLRGHDAQLLVGCEIIDAEELASMRPESLFAKVAPFSDTKEGLKIIRNGKKPDLEEITDWISFAQHNRSLRAA